MQKKKVKSHCDVVSYFKELPFYNKYIKKPKIKLLKNVDLLFVLSLYEELNVIKTSHAFRRYAMSYKTELVEIKDPINQLEASKLIRLLKTCLVIFKMKQKVLSTK